MLIKVTNRCGAGCSHCLEDSTPKGEHMSWETFMQALDFTQQVESFAWESGCPPIVLLSGGECTEHPDIVKMVEAVVARAWLPMVLTNGLWLADKELRESLLRSEWPQLFVQVTHDPRFYPQAPPRWKDPRIAYVDALTVFIPLGRGKKESERKKGVPTRQGPSSFNLRSLTRSFGDIVAAVAVLRAKASIGFSGHCIPSISATGGVVAGESNSCFKIGTVRSTNHELTEALVNMQCNGCGLEDNLTQEQKRAIGASLLFTADE